MVNVTLFELHLEDARFTANAPYSGEDPESVEVESDAPPDEEQEGGIPLGLLAVLGLVVAVASAVAAKKVLGGTE